MAEFEVVDGKSKELLNRSGTAGSAIFSWRKIGAAVGVEGYMDDGLLQDDFVEDQLGAEKRPNFQTSNDVVDMGERNILGRLAPMHGDAAHFSLQAKWNGMNAGYFRAPSCDAFDFRHQATAHQRLERFRVDVDKETENGEGTCGGHEKEIVPPAAAGGPGGGADHWD